MRKIVINTTYGGFGLSTEAFEYLIKNKNWTVTRYNDDGSYVDNSAQLAETKDSRFSIGSVFDFKYHFVDSSDSKIRVHPDVIEVVEILGDKAGDQFATLRIVEIPEDVQWQIEEYDGLEWVAEKHRTWHYEGNE
jgi:hypothetical protein